MGGTRFESRSQVANSAGVIRFTSGKSCAIFQSPIDHPTA